MGIVQKQGVRITLITYLGIIVGALNTMLIFPRVLGPEKHGLVMLLLSIATVFTQFVHLGVPNIIIRFYPYFSEKKKFIHRMAFQLPIMALMLFAVFIFLIGDTIFHSYNLNSSLFASHSSYVLPLVISLVLFEVLVAISRSELKTVFPSFLREFVLRVSTLVLLGLHFIEYIDFSEFMLFWLGIYALNVAFMSLYLIIKRLIKFNIGWPLIDDRILGKQMVSYGLVTLLTTSSIILVNRIDVFMLGYYLNLENVAFYSIPLFMATLIQIPARSIMQIGKPLLAKAWEQNDLNEIRELYRKTALNQMILGSLVFIGIWLNIDDILMLVPQKYQGVKYVYFFIGLAKLFDVSCGINGGILVTSEKYRYDLFINLLLICLTLFTNVIFIPEDNFTPFSGIEGAALATAISIIIYNLVKWYLLKKWFRLQPFNYKFLLAIAICLFTLFITSQLSFDFEMLFARIILKSIFILTVFSGLILFFRISPDINMLLYRLFNR